MAASAYWSARPSMCSPMSCSGAAYATVPTVMLVVVMPLMSSMWPGDAEVGEEDPSGHRYRGRRR